MTGDDKGTVAAIVAHCRRQIELAGPDATVVFILRGRWGKRKRARLWPGGPFGLIIDEAAYPGRVAVLFRAADVIRAAEQDAKEENNGKVPQATSDY